MINRFKKEIGFLLLGASIFSGAAIISEVKDTPPEKIVKKLSKDSPIYRKATVTERDVIDLVTGLYSRREKGDEPTLEEWARVESLVDGVRGVSDSEVLQRLDRLLEVADAAVVFQEKEISKL